MTYPPVGTNALNYSKLAFILLFLGESKAIKRAQQNMTETGRESQEAEQNVPTKSMAELSKMVSTYGPID